MAPTGSPPRACPDDAVLVVDDEPGVRDLMVRWLQASGYYCVATPTAEDALDCVDREPVAVALCDVRLPGRDGHWLAEELRRRSPETAVIMVTGASDIGSVVSTLQPSPVDYLVKPFGRDRLRKAVQRGFAWRQAVVHERQWREEIDREAQELRRTLSDVFSAVTIDSRQQLNAVLRMLTLRERDLYEHACRVEALSTRVAVALGCTRSQVEHVARAALMHDVARLALPTSLFQKPGPLSVEEQGLVREGPHFAYELLRPSAYLAEAAPLVRHRYERYDGTGFPARLAGEEIPIGSRILAVVDTYDTMLSVRSYREPATPTQAWHELKRCAATQFDPRIVDVLAFMADVSFV